MSDQETIEKLKRQLAERDEDIVRQHYANRARVEALLDEIALRDEEIAELRAAYDLTKDRE